MIKDFSKLLDTMGYNLDYSSSRALAGSLDTIAKKDDPFFNKLVRILTTRCMNEAVYFCTADFDYPEYQHYGLAAALYTHFTSPIRRYADVLVHRLLAAALDIDSLPVSISNKQKLAEVCERMNMRHRNARFASRASSDYFSYLFFKDKNIKEEGLITNIQSNGVTVLIPKYGFEGFLGFESEKELRENGNIFGAGGIIKNCYIRDRHFMIFERLVVEVKVEMKNFHKQIILTYIEPVKK
jgi:exosome complex exonuclease DIS3/RRP44